MHKFDMSEYIHYDFTFTHWKSTFINDVFFAFSPCYITCTKPSHLKCHVNCTIFQGLCITKFDQLWAEAVRVTKLCPAKLSEMLNPAASKPLMSSVQFPCKLLTWNDFYSKLPLLICHCSVLEYYWSYIFSYCPLFSLFTIHLPSNMRLIFHFMNLIFTSFHCYFNNVIKISRSLYVRKCLQHLGFVWNILATLIRSDVVLFVSSCELLQAVRSCQSPAPTAGLTWLPVLSGHCTVTRH